MQIFCEFNFRQNVKMRNTFLKLTVDLAPPTYNTICTRILGSVRGGQTCRRNHVTKPNTSSIAFPSDFDQCNVIAKHTIFIVTEKSKIVFSDTNFKKGTYFCQTYSYRGCFITCSTSNTISSGSLFESNLCPTTILIVSLGYGTVL